MLIRSKKLYHLLSVMLVMVLSISMASCGSDDDDLESDNGIVGVWQDGKEVMTLGKDGSIYLETYYVAGPAYHQKGTYSYNPDSKMMVVDIVAVPGQNSAYKATYIVQTLTSSTLVLLYTDGDVRGYYTRKTQ